MTKENKGKQMEENIKFMVDNSKKNTLRILEIPEGKEKGKGRTASRRNNHGELSFSLFLTYLIFWERIL